jgi:anaerobic selenocysteine-containing dehydrogenase
MKEVTLGKTVSRRSFVKMSAATIAATWAAGTLWNGALKEQVLADEAPGNAEPSIRMVRSTCRCCGKMECGSWITVTNGRVTHIEGDPTAIASRGNLCPKGRAAAQQLYHPDRLRYPLKRTNPRGEDPGWVRISHEEGVQGIADGLNNILEKYGQNSLKCTHGTGRITTYATEAYPTFLLQTANTGSPAGIVCKGPRLSAAALVCFPGAHWCNLIDGQRVNFQWGTNQEVSNYDNSCRVTVDEHVRAETTICVGPRMQNLGKESDIWLNLRPGTDDFLGNAMTNYCINELKSYDEVFVKKWSNAPFLVVEELEPTGWTWSKWNDPEGKLEMGSYPLKIRTKLLKESDLVEGGSVRKFAVWDNVANKIIFFDSKTCLWDGETEYTYPAEMENVYGKNIAKWRESPYCKEWEGWDGEHCQAIRQDSETGEPYKEFGGVFCEDPGFSIDIDPAIEGSYDVTLKDGRKVKAVPVWQKYAEWLADYDVDAVGEICDVDPDKIRAATAAYCKEGEWGTGGIVFNLPLEHAGNSIQTSRIPLNLSAMMRNIDGPGGQRGVENMMYTMDTLFQYHIPWFNNQLDPVNQAKVVGGDHWPLTPWFQMVGGAALFHDPISASHAILDNDPYPVRCMLSESGQHFNAGNATHNWEAFCSLDFYGAWEIWHSPTVELADILMPAAHFFEVSVARYTQGAEAAIGAQVRVTEPQGDCRWDSAVICGELSQAMGYQYWAGEHDPVPFWPKKLHGIQWPSEKNMLDMSVMGLMTDHPLSDEVGIPISIAAPSPDGNQLIVKDWDDYVAQYQEHGQWSLKEISPMGYYYRYMWGWQRPRAEDTDPLVPGFNTPTGKYEFWSTILESYHPDLTADFPEKFPMKNTHPERGAEFPQAREPWESPWNSPEKLAEYPLVYTSGRRNPLYFHNENRQQPWLREQAPAPCVQIHPDTAAELGIAQGEWVWVESERGKIRQTADLFYGIAPGTVECDHGWWYPELSAPKHGWDLSHVNCLVAHDNTHISQDPICGTPNLRGYLVKIYKATPENSPFGNPVPCDDDGTEIIHTPGDPRYQKWMMNYDEERTGEPYYFTESPTGQYPAEPRIPAYSPYIPGHELLPADPYASDPGTVLDAS